MCEQHVWNETWQTTSGTSTSVRAKKKKKKNTINFRNTCAIFCLFTLLLIRGNWLDKAQTVTPGAVHALHDAGGQKKEEKKSKRLMLMLAVSSNLLTQLTWFLKSTVAD